VAVLEHRHSGGGKDEGDGRAYIEGAKLVAAGAADVDRAAAPLFEAWVPGEIAEAAREARDLLGRLALGGERDEEGGLVRIRRLGRGQEVGGRLGLGRLEAL